MVEELTYVQKLSILLLFILAGPPFGSLPLVLLLMLRSLVDPTAMGFSIPVLIFSYPFGVLPAALAGVLFILVAPRLQAVPLYLRHYREFAVGALCGLLAAVFFYYMFNSLSYKPANIVSTSSFLFLLFPD
jgi:hypothetical protein